MKSLPPLNHKGGNLTSVHRDIRDSVLKFHTEMLRLESQIPTGPFTPGPVSQETMNFYETKKSSQMHSRVVQVFALLAVEAFLNDYGYLRLGEEAYEKVLRKRRPPLSKKLNTILREVAPDFESDPEIEIILRNLATRRNNLVHPKPEMKVWLEDGTIRQTTKRLARTDPEPAKSALEEMERFFELVAAMDPEAAFVMGCVPRRTPIPRKD
jgi:hypothetical protein